MSMDNLKLYLFAICSNQTNQVFYVLIRARKVVKVMPIGEQMQALASPQRARIVSKHGRNLVAVAHHYLMRGRIRPISNPMDTDSSKNRNSCSDVCGHHFRRHCWTKGTVG